LVRSGISLTRTPPRVEQAFIERLTDPNVPANTRLLVALNKQDIPSNVITVQLEQGPVLMRDDGQGVDQQAGDGLFSAAISLDIADLELLNRHVSEWLSKAPTIPVFEQRSLVSDRRLELLNLDRFRAGGRISIFPFPFGIPLAVDTKRTLLISDLSVVEDPTRTFNPCTNVGTPLGKWTFGRLMTEMANQPETGIAPSDFARRWLNEWLAPQTINSDVVAARGTIQAQIITPWEQASGGPGSALDLAKAPFRLLAIVNRVDLRQNLVYGGGSAGEGRFVFGALGPNCQPLQFTVIFEYGINKSGCKGVRDWGKQWLDLQALPLGSPAYNAALEAITDQFSLAGADPTALPNKSALNQLRTNEIALAAPWELREFQLVPSGPDAGQLQQVTVKQTPAFAFNNTATLANYVNLNAGAIVVGTHLVPDDFPAGNPFLGGAGPTPFGLFWDGPSVPPGPDIVPAEARHKFSLSTCNGCHAGETNTVFTHVKPAAFGVEASLSGFMTGINVTDPADGAPIRHFDDLQRRAQDLDALVNSSCLFHISHRPLLMEH
jgi:hypothetical protein